MNGQTIEDDADNSIEIGTVVFSAYVVKGEEYDRIVGDCVGKGIEVDAMDCFDYIATENMRITCVHPDESFAATGEGVGDKNEMSLALLYESSTAKALFTGDMGTEAIEHMLSLASKKGKDLSNLDLLKLPHHGSQGSLSENMYSLLKPGGTAVISCGRTNRYGHPHKEVTDALEQHAIPYLRTDQGGAIVIERH